MRETERKVLLCKTTKKSETDGYERDRSLRLNTYKRQVFEAEFKHLEAVFSI